MANALWQNRLLKEKAKFQQSHPVGFVAAPSLNPNKTENLAIWHCIVPGAPNTPYAGYRFPVTLKFPANYPVAPPVAYMPAGFMHVNVFSDGNICLSVFKSAGYTPTLSVGDLLTAIQQLYTAPNIASPANANMAAMFRDSPAKYQTHCAEQNKKFHLKL